ncbi:MAG: metal ABC transporter permease [Chthonomonadetes bacterium]|jgi:ABC-type Mn2+/Zn2+ transport system permease subunit|nr:metal ABC transporter permease [Chthonomonadetes bacterium]
MMEILQYPFFQRALISAVLLGFSLPLIGVFVVTRRLSFFSEAIAHSAFTGLALSALLVTPVLPTVIAFAVLVTLAIVFTLHRTEIPADTVIGVYLALCAGAGILLIGILQGYQPGLFQFLFGDILALAWEDVWLVAIMCAGSTLTVLAMWNALLRVSVHREMAIAMGTSAVRVDLLFLILLAVMVTLSLKLVGIVLVTAMLLLPSATARNLTRSFRGMVTIACMVGGLSSILGLYVSYWFGTASGAAIILVAALFFIASVILRRPQ